MNNHSEISIADRKIGAGYPAFIIAEMYGNHNQSLDRADGGVNSTFSIEPAEMAQLVVETERVWQALGKVSYGATEAEEKLIVFRRSLYVLEDLKVGDTLTYKNVRAIRPGLGLPTKYLPQIIGRVAKQDLKRGTALSWGLI
jgi:sialic acid synthase SpsE